jgi:hypothetical protein
MNTPDTRERRCDGRQCDGAEGVSMPSPASTRNDPRERGGCVLAWRCARGETMISRVSLGKFTLWSLSISFQGFIRYYYPCESRRSIFIFDKADTSPAPRRRPADGSTGRRDERGAQAGAACASGVDGAPSRTSTSRVPARRDALALLTSRTCSGSVGGSRCVRYH